MLKDIARIWHKGGIMKDVVEELARMIADAEFVYSRAWEALCGQAVPAELEQPLKDRDKNVNRQEREIRRMLVEHLSINPGVDASGCLAVMAMAKDAERIGDLAKDIFKLTVQIEDSGRELHFFERLDKIQSHIAQNFPRLQRAIRESSDELAREILDTYKEVKDECQALLDDLFAADLPTAEAVTTTLLVRNLARINAHIGNAASGVIFPLENIDFVSRGLRQEQQGQ